MFFLNGLEFMNFESGRFISNHGALAGVHNALEIRFLSRFDRVRALDGLLALATLLNVSALSNLIGFFSQFIRSHLEYEEFDNAKYNSLLEKLLFRGVYITSRRHILNILDHLFLQLLFCLLELDFFGADEDVGSLITRELIHSIYTSSLVQHQLTFPLPLSLSFLDRLLLLKSLDLSPFLIQDSHVLQECLMAIFDVAISENHVVC